MTEPKQTTKAGARTRSSSRQAEAKAAGYKATDLGERAINEISRAFCDCYRDDANAFKERNLDFRCSVELSPPEVYEILTRYVPGYNAFRPELVLNFDGDAQIRVAREGSVCLYVRTKADLLAQAEELQADELDEWQPAPKPGEPSVWRVWWD